MDIKLVESFLEKYVEDFRKSETDEQKYQHLRTIFSYEQQYRHITGKQYYWMTKEEVIDIARIRDEMRIKIRRIDG